MIDWRLPENRREAFMRQYVLHLDERAHPGLVYLLLPVLQEVYGSDPEWVVWLNGNTQNPVTTELILRQAPTSDDWEKAVSFVDSNFQKLEWDTDRRHQKSCFVRATTQWAAGERKWPSGSWAEVWDYAFSRPYMGRLSAWSMSEYARILGLHSQDADTLLLHDKSGSTSHRNGLCLLDGHDSTYWGWDEFDMLVGPDEINRLEALADSLLGEARSRTLRPEDATRLTLESALCTFKSWNKPNRRYPGVYIDMHYDRIYRAEARCGRLALQWQARLTGIRPELLKELRGAKTLGLNKEDQNLYRTTGTPAVLGLYYDDMESERWTRKN